MNIPKNQRCKDKWSHSFFGNTCEWCGISQKEIGEKKITKIKPIIIKKKNITSEFQLFVNDTMEYLKEDVYKKGNFSKYAGIIKRFGMFQVRIWINEMKQKGISSPRYFWGIVKQTFKRLKK